MATAQTSHSFRRSIQHDRTWPTPFETPADGTASIVDGHRIAPARPRPTQRRSFFQRSCRQQYTKQQQQQPDSISPCHLLSSNIYLYKGGRRYFSGPLVQGSLSGLSLTIRSKTAFVNASRNARPSTAASGLLQTNYWRGNQSSHEILAKNGYFAHHKQDYEQYY